MIEKVKNDLQSGQKVELKDFLIYVARHLPQMKHLQGVKDSVLKEKEDYYPQSYTVQFHKEELKRMNKEHEKFLQKSDEELFKQIEDKHEQEMKDYKFAENTISEAISNFKKTKKEVENWLPPTEDHTELKETALKLITEYLTNYQKYKKENIKKPKKKTIEEWRDEVVSKQKKAIEEYEKGYQKEQELLKDPKFQTKWVEALFESLIK